MSTAKKNQTRPVAPAPAHEAASYLVASPLDHDGVRYAIGDTVELTAEQLAALPAGIVTVAAEEPAE